MKQILFIAVIAVFAFTSCGNRENTKTSETAQVETTVQTDDSTVYIYYFHGKQRCKTCIAVGDVSEQAIKDMYANNPNVKFVEVKTEEKANAALVEKYKVTWNALIIAKGDHHIEITQKAFANAVNNPETLTALIKTEVDKRL